MRDTKPIKVPRRVYDYLKDKATKRQTNMRIEAGLMFDKYLNLKGMENKLKGKKVFYFK